MNIQIKDTEQIAALFRSIRESMGFYPDEQCKVELKKIDTRVTIEYASKILFEDQHEGNRAIAAKILALSGEFDAISPLAQTLVQAGSDWLRSKIASALGKTGRAEAIPVLIRSLQYENEAWEVRASAIEALGELNSVEAIPILVKLFGEEENGVVRHAVVRALSMINHTDTIEPLINILLDDKTRYECQLAAIGLQNKESISWREKANLVILRLQLGKQQRSDIDASAVVLAMEPSQKEHSETRNLLADFLIEKAIDENDRMTGILAKLIIQTSGDNVSLAGERINNFGKTNNVPEGKLRKLRIEIGGETALDPIMQVLQDDLLENFRKPISVLNDLTQSNWQKTVLYAQYGFLARIAMSILVFLAGMVLLCVSSWRIMFGQLETDQLYGASVSFVSGLGSMLLIIYRGPLQEIRTSVNDLGIASAAFIAYVHRVLQISHTFSYYYLKQEISFKWIEKSSRLIKEAVEDATSRLQIGKVSEQNSGSTKQVLFGRMRNNG